MAKKTEPTQLDEFRGVGGEYIIDKNGKRVPVPIAEDAPLEIPTKSEEE